MRLRGFGTAFFAKGNHGLIGRIGQHQPVKTQGKRGGQLQQRGRAGEVGAFHPVGDGLGADPHRLGQLLLIPALVMQGSADRIGVENFVHNLGIMGGGSLEIKFDQVLVACLTMALNLASEEPLAGLPPAYSKVLA